MPYVPSKKTDGVSDDREVLDAAVECLAKRAANVISNNRSLIASYEMIFSEVAKALNCFIRGGNIGRQNEESELARVIFRISLKYGYEGAYLGELNYALTRFIQRVPQLKVESGAWDQELRYWIYAATVEALTYAASQCLSYGYGLGIGGVFEDIKDEYKRRVNVAYEAAQILKNGDCYDTPYYTRLIEVVDENGTLIGHQEVMLKRSDNTLHRDLLDFQIVAKKR